MCSSILSNEVQKWSNMTDFGWKSDTLVSLCKIVATRCHQLDLRGPTSKGREGREENRCAVGIFNYFTYCNRKIHSRQTHSRCP